MSIWENDYKLGANHIIDCKKVLKILEGAYVIVELGMVQTLPMFKEDEYEGEEKLGNS